MALLPMGVFQIELDKNGHFNGSRHSSSHFELTNIKIKQFNTINFIIFFSFLVLVVLFYIYSNNERKKYDAVRYCVIIYYVINVYQQSICEYYQEFVVLQDKINRKRDNNDINEHLLQM